VRLTIFWSPRLGVIFRNEETDEGSRRAISSGSERHGCHFPIFRFPRQNPANVTRSELVVNEIRDSSCWCCTLAIISTTIAIKFSRAIVNVGVAGKKGRGAVEIAILSNEQTQRESRALTTCFSVM